MRALLEEVDKKKLIWMIVLFVLGCMLCGFVIFAIAGTDREGPVITFTDKELSYKEGSDQSLLLQGVTAIDEVEGDVSHTLIIENIIPLSGDTTANVIYAARDKHNNITKQSRLIAYKPLPVPVKKPDKKEGISVISENAVSVSAISDNSISENQTQEPEENERDTEPRDEANENTEPPAEETEPEAPAEEPVVSENQLPPASPFDIGAGNHNMQDIVHNTVAAQNPAAPAIKLNTHSITSNVGDIVNKYAYIAEATDDKDVAMNFLHIDGNVDITKVGDYELRYYVIDSDGNKSNVEVLKVKIQ